MNRSKYISKAKVRPKPKPAFVPVVLERGDKVRNTETLYTDGGYYEIGCEWHFLRRAGRDWGDICWVNYLVDDDFPESGSSEVFDCCFEVVEKGWFNHPRHEWNKKNEPL